MRTHLKAALLAIHFPCDGLGLEGLVAKERSFLSARKTLLKLIYIREPFRQEPDFAVESINYKYNLREILSRGKARA